ncbi:MAG TPA: hypothetical protein VFS16_08015 [Acidimicrobiia bacterium]|nr:hypothetical protein [Acidimicrobiia bacterium]
MLPLNRIYTPEELRAVARLSPADPRKSVGSPRTAPRTGGTRGTRGSLLAVVQRLVARGGFRRAAPGTT